MCETEAESAAADIHSNQILTRSFINDRGEDDSQESCQKHRVLCQRALLKSKHRVVRDCKN